MAICIIGVAIYINHFVMFLSLALIHIQLSYINLVMFIIVVACVSAMEILDFIIRDLAAASNSSSSFGGVSRLGILPWARAGVKGFI